MYADWPTVLASFAGSGLPARLVRAVSESGSHRRMAEDRYRKRMGLVAAVELERGREIFTLSPSRRARPAVLDASSRRRHLLLLLKHGALERRILFGHDERHLFWSILPGAERVFRLEGAFEALKPRELRRAADGPRESRETTGGTRESRETTGGPRESGGTKGGLPDLQEAMGDPRGRGPSCRTIRQGEWFFEPAPDFAPEQWMYARSPFLRRGGHSRRGHDHVVDEATGFVDERGRAWCFVRGAVRHPEHATIHLPFWHCAHLNLEEGKGSAPRIGNFPILD